MIRRILVGIPLHSMKCSRLDPSRDSAGSAPRYDLPFIGLGQTETLPTFRRVRDKRQVNRFAEDAQNLLDAALAAVQRGESCQEMTILIGRDGAIQLCADSDWPLDSLMLDRGARTGYRVSPARNSVRVEGREGLLRCVLESRVGQAILSPACRRLLLSS